ncbi:MAG TPA: FMN-binding negative transcriptional regulator [Streptosporangiaceae bacterium]|jgi:transcriptional regulator
MYIPAHFAAADIDQVAQLVERAGAADLVTFDGERLIATLLPVIWDSSAGQHGRLLGHIALANPQWKSARGGLPGLAIVHGPQAYISPSWYAAKKEDGRVVPTWNYTTVHFTGPVTFHQDPQWLLDIVTQLTGRYEHGRPDRWRVDDAPEAYIAGQLRGIVGVELTITQIEAKEKLSQNRGAADRAGVIDALSGAQDQQEREIAGLMADREAAGQAPAGQ